MADLSLMSEVRKLAKEVSEQWLDRAEIGGGGRDQGGMEVGTRKGMFLYLGCCEHDVGGG